MFFVVCWFFSKSIFSKHSFGNTIRVSNSLDPDQARNFVGLICVKTVCKCYQQITLVGEEFIIYALADMELLLIRYTESHHLNAHAQLSIEARWQSIGLKHYKLYVCEQWMIWWDCTDAQTRLIRRLSHM